MEKFLESFPEGYKNEIIASFLKFQTSTASNIIPDIAYLDGCCRYFDDDLMKKYVNKLEQTIEEISKEFDIKIELTKYLYPIVRNDATLIEELKKIVPDLTTDNLPMKASEDFSEFGLEVPSCFFFYGIGKKSGILHTANYNFNDDCLNGMCELWHKIMLNRLIAE